MVYMGVEVIACNKIYGDGVKAIAAACVKVTTTTGVKAIATVGIPHLLTTPNGLWCTIDVM